MDGTKIFFVSLLICTGCVEGYFFDASHRSYITHDFWARDDPGSPDGMQEAVKDAIHKNPAVGAAKRQYTHAQSEARKLEREEKYPFIAGLHRRLEKVFGKYSDHWYMDWKLWVGGFFWVVVWAKWLVYGYDEIYYQRALFAFGINILILHHLQYAASVKAAMLVVSLCLSFQAVFQNCVHFRSAFEEKCGPANELKLFNADTLYLDLALPSLQIGVLFVAQIAIWWFYMTSILGNFHFSHVNYAFWVVSFLAMQMTMIFNRGADSVLGLAFPIHDVYSLILHCDKGHFLEVKDDDQDENTVVEDATNVAFTMTKANIITRGIVGFFCNGILREIMAYTIPLMLMGFSEPMDFVVYCVGVNFICTLDDMHSRRYALKAKEGQEAEAKPGLTV